MYRRQYEAGSEFLDKLNAGDLPERSNYVRLHKIDWVSPQPKDLHPPYYLEFDGYSISGKVSSRRADFLRILSSAASQYHVTSDIKLTA